MDQTQLLNALRALGNDVTYDPEHYPKGPAEEDIPNLLGALALMLDVEIAERLRPGSPAMDAFRCGYVEVSTDVHSFVRTVAVRGFTTASLLNAPALSDNQTLQQFVGTVGGAADQLLEDFEL